MCEIPLEGLYESKQVNKMSIDKKTGKWSALFICQAALIAAVYVALTYVFAPISFGAIQFRIAEALTILPIFTPAAIPGLFVGCFVGNILGGAVLPDIIFGSIATLIGAVFTYLLRKKSPFIAVLPPILSNTIIIPFILYYVYGVEMFFPLIMLTVCIGEVGSCGVLGIPLCYALKKYRGIFPEEKDTKEKNGEKKDETVEETKEETSKED